MISIPLLMTALSALFVFSSGGPAAAQDGIQIDAPYARVFGASAKSGAVFMTILNHSAQDDRLISVTTDAAERAALHTNLTGANGVVQMVEATDGFAITGTEARALARGGDHIMLFGLKRALKRGDVITLTLTFARGGDITVKVPVDNDRKAEARGLMDYSGNAAPVTN